MTDGIFRPVTSIVRAVVRSFVAEQMMSTATVPNQQAQKVSACRPQL